MKEHNRVTLIATIGFLLIMVAYATYAAIAHTANITNLNITAQTNGSPVVTASGGNSLNLVVDLPSMYESNINNVVATAEDNITITLETDSLDRMCCSYDLMWEWAQTNNTKNQYHLTEGALNEYVLTGTPTEEKFLNKNGNMVIIDPQNTSFSIQVPNYNASSLKNSVYTGTICNDSGSLTTKATQTYNLNVSFYNLPVVQDAFKNATFNGYVKMGNVSCQRAQTPTAFAVYSDDDNSLTIYKNRDIVVNGSQYRGKEATAVYTGFEENTSNSQPGWSAYSNAITSVTVADIIEPKNLYRWFYEFKNAHTFDLSKIDTSNVINMSYMFSNAGYSAENWSVSGLSEWDVSSVTNMGSMFDYAGAGADNWSIGDLSSWDVSSVTDMESMFDYAGVGAENWSIGDLSNWDVSSVTDMESMFYGAGNSVTENWSIGDLSSWDVSSVTNMSNMFSSTGNSVTDNWSIGDLSGWDVSNVTDMSSMFAGAGYSAENWSIGDLANWDVSNVTSMSHMFASAGYSVTGNWDFGDISSWNLLSIDYMSSMFSQAPVKVLDLSGWNLENVSLDNMDYMFEECTKVTEALARSQADAEKLNASSEKPSSWSFVSVAPVISPTINNQASNLVTIAIPTFIEANVTKFTLTPIDNTKVVQSFVMNGIKVNGNTFTLSSSDTFTITNVVLVDPIIIESEHNPYPNNLYSKVYGEATFDGATSLTVILDTQTQGPTVDWIYLYDANGNIVNNKKYGKYIRKTHIITVPGNYVKIVFKTDGSGNDYYGFKAIIYPND